MFFSLLSIAVAAQPQAAVDIVSSEQKHVPVYANVFQTLLYAAHYGKDFYAGPSNLYTGPQCQSTERLKHAISLKFTGTDCARAGPAVAEIIKNAGGVGVKDRFTLEERKCTPVLAQNLKFVLPIELKGRNMDCSAKLRVIANKPEDIVALTPNVGVAVSSEILHSVFKGIEEGQSFNSAINYFYASANCRIMPGEDFRYQVRVEFRGNKTDCMDASQSIKDFLLFSLSPKTGNYSVVAAGTGQCHTISQNLLWNLPAIGFENKAKTCSVGVTFISRPSHEMIAVKNPGAEQITYDTLDGLFRGIDSGASFTLIPKFTFLADRSCIPNPTADLQFKINVIMKGEGCKARAPGIKDHIRYALEAPQRVYYINENDICHTVPRHEFVRITGLGLRSVDCNVDIKIERQTA